MSPHTIQVSRSLSSFFSIYRVGAPVLGYSNIPLCHLRNPKFEMWVQGLWFGEFRKRSPWNFPVYSRESDCDYVGEAM